MPDNRSLSKAAYACLSLASFVFVAMLVRTVLTKVDALQKTPFVGSALNSAESIPVALPYTLENGSHIYRFKLDTTFDRIPDLIALKLATSNTSPVAIHASITNIEKTCRWTAASKTTLQDNASFRWNLEECKNRKVESLEVEIQTDIPVTLYVWTTNILTNALPSESLVRMGDDPVHAIQGYFETKTSKPSKNVSQLMSYIWDQTGTNVIAVFLLGGGLLAILGFFGLLKPTGQAKLFYFASAWLGLTLLYSVICPPFQAPDEPDHLLSYAVISKDPVLHDKLLKLANIGHLERIKFFADQRFTPTDVDSPMNEPWGGHIAPTDMSIRSPLTTTIWKIYEWLPHPEKAGSLILYIRVMNSLFVLLLFLFALYEPKEVRKSNNAGNQLAILLVPTIFFFSMHVSNYFTAIAIYLASAQIFLRMLSKENILTKDLLILGICAGLSPFTVASGSGALLVWAIVLTSSLFSQNIRKIGRWRLIVDIIVFSAPIILFQCLFNYQEVISLFKDLMAFSLDQLTKSKNALPLLLPLVFVFRGCADMLMRRHVNHTIRSLRIFWSVLIFFFVSYLIVQSVSENWRLALPDIEKFPTQDHFKYAWMNVLAFWVNLFPGPVDFFMSASFWSGFGWLEFNLPLWLINCIRTFTGLMFIYGLYQLLWSQELWKASRGFSLLLSVNALLWGMAYKLSEVPVNLHGRYLIFCFILVLTMSTLGMQSIGSKNKSTQGSAHLLGSLGYSLILAIHFAALNLLLHRYFI
ncbi:MAG: hypothetical protein EOP06_02460 [Proteobacteria bacterium]|nr:MAG: hypothetical protein EOP06_02460 [Pseudomonadota bacterium]